MTTPGEVVKVSEWVAENARQLATSEAFGELAGEAGAAFEVAALRSKAQALQEQAAETFDQADALEQQGALDTAAEDTEAALAKCGDMLVAAIETAKSAKRAKRDAEDRSEAAAEEHRKLAARFADDSAAMSATDARHLLMEVSAAQIIAADRSADKDLALSLHADAELAVTKLRDMLRELEAASRQARNAAENPAAAPWSWMTAWSDGVRRIVSGQDDGDNVIVRHQLQMLAEGRGLDRLWRAQGRREAEGERADIAQANRIRQASERRG